ncbi:protein ABC transporter 1, mitochondrial [Tanacetum coccineum]
MQRPKSPPIKDPHLLFPEHSQNCTTSLKMQNSNAVITDNEDESTTTESDTETGTKNDAVESMLKNSAPFFVDEKVLAYHRRMIYEAKVDNIQNCGPSMLCYSQKIIHLRAAFNVTRCEEVDSKTKAVCPSVGAKMTYIKKRKTMPKGMNGNGRNPNQHQFIRMKKVDFLKFLGDDVKGQFIIINGENVSWNVYKSSILQRFSTVYDDPISKIRKVKYQTNAREYQDAFDTFFSRVDISEEYVVKATLEAIKKKSKTTMTFSKGRFGSGMGQGSNSKPPLLALPAPNTSWKPKPNTPLNTPVRKQLTQKEYQEKRAQNLCFYCDQKYTPRHKCSGKLYSLVLLADEDEKYFKTMRVTGKVGKHEIHILVDCGSTHNFLDNSVAKKIGCPFKDTCPLVVTVGGGKQLIGGCEMVLGIQWLATLGDIKCNFSQLKIEFVYNRRRMVLRGAPKTTLQWMEGKNQERKVEGVPHAELLMLSVFPNASIQLLCLTNKSQVVPKELQKVVDQYDNVFAVPKEQLNKNIVKDKFLIPIIEELIDELHGAAIFSKFRVSHWPSSNSDIEEDNIDLVLKKNAFKWNLEAQLSFEALKKAMVEAPVMGLHNFNKPFVIETDASGVGLGTILQQKGHPIA